MIFQYILSEYDIYIFILAYYFLLLLVFLLNYLSTWSWTYTYPYDYAPFYWSRMIRSIYNSVAIAL